MLQKKSATRNKLADRPLLARSKWAIEQPAARMQRRDLSEGPINERNPSPEYRADACEPTLWCEDSPGWTVHGSRGAWRLPGAVCMVVLPDREHHLAIKTR